MKKATKEIPRLAVCQNCNYLFVEKTVFIFCCNECKKEYLKKAKYKKPEIYTQSNLLEKLQLKTIQLPKTKKCIVCSSTIPQKSKNKKYCSKECKKKAQKEKRLHKQNLENN